eukprot:scaffold296_cov164-Ochromonas_danica.AAC.8
MAQPTETIAFLRLDLSLRQNDDTLEATYRDEGLSVGADHMRLYGEEVEMEVSYNDLILGKRIGHGACSSVNLAQHRRTGETYAIKLFNIFDRDQASQLYNEILLLTTFSCDALISLKGAFHDSGSIGIILEYMDRGNLEWILNPSVVLPEPVLAAIAFQMVWGLGYLHHEKQIHRDIKPANALMNSLGHVKLSDFGISKELEHSTAMSHSSVGTYIYMSPERLLGEKYDSSADVWSVGLSIVQLWTKAYPFQKSAETPVHLSATFETFDVYSFSKSSVYPSSMRPFIRSTLAKDPAERSSCLELIRDCSWFQTHQFTDLETAHEVIKSWLKDVDRQRKMGPPSKPAQPLPPQSQAQPPRADIRLPKSSFDMSGTWGSEDGMAMSLSMNQSQRRLNPFTSSGSFSSSFMQQPPQQVPYQYGRRPVSTMQEEEYEDDFEEDVDIYDQNRHLPPSAFPDLKKGRKEESKLSESKYSDAKSDSRYHK